MKKLILFIIIIVLFLVSCKDKLSSPKNYRLTGKIEFEDAAGNTLDSLFTANIYLYSDANVSDTLKALKKDYPNIGPSMKNVFFQYLVSDNIPQYKTTTDDYGNFTIKDILPDTYLIVYSANGFGYHKISYNFNSDANLNLTMIKKQELINYTNLEGSINWKENSFYKIDGILNISENANLTIEKNVIIELTQFSKIINNGSLIINAASNKPVIFTSDNSSENQENWDRIENHGKIITNYTIIEHSSTAFLSYGNLTLDNSAIFNMVLSGVTSYDNSDISVNKCLFFYAKDAIGFYGQDVSSQNATIKNSLILDNINRGCYIEGSSPLIENNIFVNNKTHISIKTIGHTHSGTYPIIRNCLFNNSTYSAIVVNRAGPLIEKCEFNYNYYYCFWCYNVTRTKINQNNFYENSTFIVKLSYRSGGSSLDMTNNWWGTTSNEQIQNKIYDENDEPGGNDVGYVNYIPWETHKVVNAGPQ